MLPEAKALDASLPSSSSAPAPLPKPPSRGRRSHSHAPCLFYMENHEWNILGGGGA
jgi:hypothetical protein